MAYLPDMCFDNGRGGNWRKLVTPPDSWIVEADRNPRSGESEKARGLGHLPTWRALRRKAC